ncbi:hypothetical protein CSB45_14310 [candidate division KSB3 bacterium]|uniref:Uncharacterized protein n=1 Tax=candidate division KSB3 bacterium TaxID=2044937 RepID=A0A2G6E1K3_9BACT|nr:MAG: hypothetical protein CSB45_14310 [candidate division KSB3 bacterium]PIE30327.1 MAG: hypothetical protein CSA57_03310 [candidate division KSB3 bacterium]
MDNYDFSPADLAGLSDTTAAKDQICPGLQRFCPHYTSSTCDVKYSECVLLNSLKTSETLLRMEREKLLKEPTPQNLAFLARINEVLHEKNPELQVSPSAIVWSRFQGRLVATGLLLLIISAAAVLLYLNS